MIDLPADGWRLTAAPGLTRNFAGDLPVFVNGDLAVLCVTVVQAADFIRTGDRLEIVIDGQAKTVEATDVVLHDGLPAIRFRPFNGPAE